MKSLKITAALLGVLLALAAGLMIAASLLVDGDWLKGQLAAVVQEKTGRSLRISGGAALSFWPGPGIRVAAVSLSEPAGPREFAAVDSARVSVALLPLLAGRLVVDRIEIEGLRVTLIRHRNGSLNIDDLIGGRSSPGSRAMPAVQLAGLTLTNSRVTWLDERSGRSTVVSGLELFTGPVAVEAGGLRLAGLRLAASAQSGADRYRLQLAAPAVVAQADALTIDRLDLELDARAGAADIKARLGTRLAMQSARRLLTLDGLKGHLEIGHPQLPMKTLRLPLSGTARAELAKPAVQVNLASQLDNAGITLALEVSRFSPPALSFDLQIARLDVDRYLPSIQGGSGSSGGASGPRGLDLDGTVRIGQLRFAGFESRDARLSVSLRDGRLEYSGLAQQAVKAGVNTVVRQKLGEGLGNLLPRW